MLMIRLARFGAKKKPFYRIVVIEKERARNSRNLEVVGHYNPDCQSRQVNAEPRAHRPLDQERRPDVRYREASWLRRTPPRPRNRSHSDRIGRLTVREITATRLRVL